MYHTVGSKYNEVKDKDITDIAKLVRQDLKTLFTNYPHAKSSVRIKRYAGGQPLHVIINGTGFESRSKDAKLIETAAQKLVDQYNFDDSDSMSDYFHVNFYSGVRVES